MVEQMFDIVRGKILSLPFGSCCHNGSVFQMGDLCGFENFCFGWLDKKGRKEVGKTVEGGKCQRRVLSEISFCLFQHQIADAEVNASLKPFQDEPACRTGW